MPTHESSPASTLPLFVAIFMAIGWLGLPIGISARVMAVFISIAVIAEAAAVACVLWN